jgi:hypothetical protein
MLTVKVADGSHLSAVTRYESLVGVSNAIGTHRDPQDLFSALVRELHRVVRFDYVGVSIHDEKSNTFHRFLFVAVLVILGFLCFTGPGGVIGPRDRH